MKKTLIKVIVAAGIVLGATGAYACDDAYNTALMNQTIAHMNYAANQNPAKEQALFQAKQDADWTAASAGVEYQLCLFANTHEKSTTPP
jgi:hypothetical protein